MSLWSKTLGRFRINKSNRRPKKSRLHKKPANRLKGGDVFFIGEGIGFVTIRTSEHPDNSHQIRVFYHELNYPEDRGKYYILPKNELVAYYRKRKDK